MPGKNTHNNITNTTAKKKDQLSFTNSPMEQTEYMVTTTPIGSFFRQTPYFFTYFYNRVRIETVLN